MAFRNPAFPGGGHPGKPFLTSSVSSLSDSVSSRHPGHSHHGHHHNALQAHAANSMSKTYRQASTLFLTRRLPEAMTTLLPLITPPFQGENGDAYNAPNGSNGGADSSRDPGLDSASSPAPAATPAPASAPIASASRTTRTKVWSLYLTILNDVVELEARDGKDAFGAVDWRAICAKVRDGTVWDEVVCNGYHGIEGDVDADVIITLATLLLVHARSQSITQKRLESYLSSAQRPHLDLGRRLDEAAADAAATTPGRHRSLSRQRRSPAKAGSTSGADTPRDLNARVKILELYTLHVLPRNDEWDYAHEFISASPLLDEERRDAFLQALQTLREERLDAEQREREEHRQKDEQLQRDLEEAERVRAANEEREERRRIEEEKQQQQQQRQSKKADEDREGYRDTVNSDAGARRHRPSSSAGGSTRGGTSTNSSRPAKPPRSAVAAPKSKAPLSSNAKGKAVVSKPSAPPPMSLGARTALLFSNLRALIDHMSASLQASPVSLVRTLVFIVALLVLLGRRNARERISRVLKSSWNKVKATAGMGVKVSYI